MNDVNGSPAPQLNTLPPPSAAFSDDLDGGSSYSRRPWNAIAYALLLWLTIVSGLTFVSHRDPLRRAWHAAEDAYGYSVEGTTSTRIAGVTSAFSVTGVGSASGPLALSVRPFGSFESPSSDVRIEWPTVRNAAGAVIAPRTLGALLPAGDPLAFLASGHAARNGPVEMLDGHSCRRVDFLVGARAYATWWEKSRRLLPINASAGGLWRFEGSGSVWIDESTDRPCRIIARVELPRMVGDSPGIGEADWYYSAWR